MEKAIKKNKNAGYTLIELIVVIMIVAILSSGAVVGFSSYYNARVDSALQKLMLALSQTRQEAIIREEGSVRMELYQDSGGDCSAKVIFNDGTSDQVLVEYQICSSRIKLSVKTTIGTTTYLSYSPSTDPTVVVVPQFEFHFEKSTGGLTENYTDIILEGSEAKNIIIVRETGRCFYEP